MSLFKKNEKRKVYINEKGTNDYGAQLMPQCYIKYNGQNLPLQSEYYKNGLPLMTDNHGLSYYTVVDGKRIDLEGHPAETKRPRYTFR